MRYSLLYNFLTNNGRFSPDHPEYRRVYLFNVVVLLHIAVAVIFLVLNAISNNMTQVIVLGTCAVLCLAILVFFHKTDRLEICSYAVVVLMFCVMSLMFVTAGHVRYIFVWISVFPPMVFFMLGTNFVPLRGIPVELPQAEGELSYKAKALIVTIDRNAVIYFGDMIVSSKSELKSRVSDARSRRSAGNQREQLIVRADVNAPLQTIAVAFTVAQELNMDAILITRTEAPAGKTTIIEKD